MRLSTSVGSGTVPRVAIHADADGGPGSRLRTLVNPASLDDDTATAEEFTTTTLVLQANTTYWVVVTPDFKQRRRGFGHRHLRR